ncbi:MAG: HIT family protein [Actinomycetota bacterium]|nr:HIT family protein [Actinomycetota bacterium]
MPDSCVFCQRIDAGDLSAENDLAAAFPDEHPVSPGHMLIVPKRHEPDLFALTDEQQDAVWALLRRVHSRLERDKAPAAYRVQVRIGEAAGQTVMHAHVHLIPQEPGGSPAEPR